MRGATTPPRSRPCLIGRFTMMDMTSLPRLTEPLTDGVVTLRRFTFDDVPAVTRACQDPEISRWTAGIPAPYEEVHARGWIARHDHFWDQEGTAAFAFCDSKSGELLGSMALGEVDFTARSAVAGYWAARRGLETVAPQPEPWSWPAAGASTSLV